MSDEKSTLGSLVTEEPGKETKQTGSTKDNDTLDDDPLPSLNPIPSSWISAGASWLNSAKEKTKNTFVLMKKDLAEFGDAMSQEVSEFTSAAKGGIDTAASVIKEQAQYLEKLVTPDEEGKPFVAESETSSAESDLQSPIGPLPKSRSSEDSLAAKVEKSAVVGLGWVKSVVDTVTDTVKSLAVEETTTGEEEITEIIRPRAYRRTNLPHEKLLKLQSSEDTFSKEPENVEGFKKWVSRFHMEEYDAETHLLLIDNPKLREIHTKLRGRRPRGAVACYIDQDHFKVPTEMENEVFWSRYFFAVEIAEMDEELQHSFALKELSVKTQAEEKRSKKVSPKLGTGESPGSDGSVAVVDQQPTSPAASADDWSVCSEKNYVEEISSTNGDDEQTGPLTPRAKSDEESKDAKKEDNWVNWDE